MSKKKSKIVIYIAMSLIAIAFIFPILWTLMSSFKGEQDIVSYPPKMFPTPWTIGNYAGVLSKYPYMNWMANSIIVTVGSTLLVLVLSSLAAYAFARMEFKGKKVLFAVITAMMLIPIQSYMIPLFKLISMVGLRSTPALAKISLILSAGANITSLYILTSFFKEIPDSLEDSAMIDGCSSLRFFLQILLPLSKAALSSVAILTFIGNWNQFLWPSILLNGDANLTLPVGIARYFGGAGQDAAFQYGPSLAASCMAVIPTIAIFLMLQKYFIEGIAHAGIKG